MSILKDFERRLEGAVEGFFARAFRSGLQPVELAKAIQRYMGNYQQVGVDGIIVPNVFRFSLASDDLDRFGGYTEALQRELAEVVQRTAGDRGWTLKGPVRIEFEEAEQVRVGTYELRGKVEAREHSRDSRDHRDRAGRGDGQAAQPSPGAAGAPKTQVLSVGPPTLVLAHPGGATTRLTGTATIGRLPECDVRLDDPSVSRRHAHLSASGNRWVVEDLDSTNGTNVNGEAAHRAELSDGDRLELGSVTLTVRLEA